MVLAWLTPPGALTSLSGEKEMRNFGADAVRDFLAAIGMAAVVIGVVGLSATLLAPPADVAALEQPITTTVVAWQLR